MQFEILSPSDQLVDYLNQQLLEGRWINELPGTPALAEELGVDRKTIAAAFKILEEEGVVESQGPGKPRKIKALNKSTGRRLKIHFLPYDDIDSQRPFIMQLMHETKSAGHHFTTMNKTLVDLGMNVDRVARFVKKNPADAWLVLAAPRKLLDWFATQEQPAFALFGRRRQVPIASVGPDKEKALREAVRRLVELGHQYIVYIAREERRKPSPGFIESCYLDELKACGMSGGAYNLPDWEDNPVSFHDCLKSLFRHTPPTAIILDESQFYIAAQQRLSLMGLSVPRDVSLICSDSQALLSWCQPSISHIHWDTQLVIKETLRWIRRVAKRKKDLRQAVYTPAEFVEGGTIGPATGAITNRG